ncbi:MAG TPA: IPT/TIG domain-containing protein [Acidimicrobiales bacterium]|nr:IPT/TIG domain-containing protein [Acidimicrobiales bacterium]
MTRPWRSTAGRRCGPLVALLLTATALSACEGWYTQSSSTDGSSLSAISCPTASECVAVGSDAAGDAVVEETTDAGGRWVADTHGVTGLGLDAVSCPDAGHCVAVGGTSEGGIIAPSNAVLVTTDGGATWRSSTVDTVDGYLTSVSCSDIEHCWATAAVGIVGRSAVIATTDAGASWSLLPWSAPSLPDRGPAPMSSVLDGIACPTTGHCLAVGQATYETTTPSQENEGVVSTTSDGGKTWQSQLVAANDLTAISCPGTGDCVVAGQDTVVAGLPSTYSTYHLVSTDGGASWTLSTLVGGAQFAGGNAPGVDALSCADAGHCVAVGVAYGGDPYRTAVVATADGGTTWTNQATPLPAGDPLEGVACVSAASCWGVGFTAAGSVVLHTVTGGEALPSVTGISPASGPSAGGTPVTITGVGFGDGTTSVLFGAVPATDVTVVSRSEITAVAPAGPAGGSTVDVTVTNPLGTSPVTTGDRYGYQGTATAALELRLRAWLRSTRR